MWLERCAAKTGVGGGCGGSGRALVQARQRERTRQGERIPQGAVFALQAAKGLTRRSSAERLLQSHASGGCEASAGGPQAWAASCLGSPAPSSKFIFLHRKAANACQIACEFAFGPARIREISRAISCCSPLSWLRCHGLVLACPAEGGPARGAKNSRQPAFFEVTRNSPATTSSCLHGQLANIMVQSLKQTTPFPALSSPFARVASE